MFHNPVLPGVIGDDRKAAMGSEGVPQDREGAFEPIELVVDRNPDRLKEPREIRGATPGTEHCPDGIDEIVTRHQWPPFSAPVDLPGQGSCSALIPVRPKDVTQFVRRRIPKQIGRRRPGGTHPHVEGRPGPEREAASVRIELMGGDPEVEEDEVRPELPNRELDRLVIERAQQRPDPAGRPLIPNRRYCFGVPVGGEHGGAHVDEPGHMATPTRGEVGHPAPRSGELGHLGEEDGLMVDTLGHAHKIKAPRAKTRGALVLHVGRG